VRTRGDVISQNPRITITQSSQRRVVILTAALYSPDLWIRSICLALETQSRTLSLHRFASALRPSLRAMSARFPQTRTFAVATVCVSLNLSVSGFRRAM
jgi:hypothetical protein